MISRMSAATTGLVGITNLATHTAFSLWAAASTVLALIVLIASFFALARLIGNAGFVCVIVGLYGGYALYALFPYLSYLPRAPAGADVATHALVYAAFVFAFYLILRRVVVPDFVHLSPFAVLVLSFFSASFLLAFGFHLFAVTRVHHFSSQIVSLFAPGQYFFWWFVAPGAVLFFFLK